ncbi:MAG TPA: hypothetical protein VFC80_02145 [Sphaerochaeta sp.]|nr:hypothetical protein [Sphaerochaeta sp.]
MAYYYFIAESAVPLYTTRRAARALLYRAADIFAVQRAKIIDYLLLPYSFEALLYSVFKRRDAQPLTEEALPAVFAHLAREPEEPYSGLYELFHKSHCIACLGKSGVTLPYTLGDIIAMKRSARELDLVELSV